MSVALKQFAPRVSQEALDVMESLKHLASKGGKKRAITQGSLVEDMVRVYAGQLLYGPGHLAYIPEAYLDSSGWSSLEEYREAVQRFRAALNRFYGPGDGGEGGAE